MRLWIATPYRGGGKPYMPAATRPGRASENRVAEASTVLVLPMSLLTNWFRRLGGEDKGERERS